VDLPPSPEGGDEDAAAVPHRLVAIGVADARELRLGTERHRDARLQGTLEQATADAAVAGIELELPLAVEVQPILADELRAGIFGTRDHWRSYRGRSERGPE